MAKQKDLELSEEMINNIKNYGDQIQTIEDFVTAIRKTVGYHIGGIGTKGHMTLIKEIFQNAFDECIKANSPGNYVKAIFDERNLSTTVIDNGRGIPFDRMVDAFTSAYTSSNYSKELGQYSSGINGSGAKLTMALSAYFHVESCILGKSMALTTEEGKMTTKDIVPVKEPIQTQGTMVSFIPSIDALGHMETTVDDVYTLFFGLFPLLPIGTVVEFVGIDKTGKMKYNETRTNKDGIVSSLIETTQNPLIAPICFGADNGTTKAEIAFTFDASDVGGAEIVASYSNFCITLGGTHRDGFMDGLCNFFRNYMNKIYLGEKSKITVVNNDIKGGLRAVVNAAHLNPIFNAQAKEILRNEDMYPFTRDLTYKSLEQWIKVNPGPLQKLCKYFKDTAELRTKSDESKIKLSNSYAVSKVNEGLPAKFIRPSGKEHLEFIIVEGDSALGPALVSRNSDCQGIFPIKGKLKNAFEHPKATFLANEEVASIIAITGGGWGKNFDLSKVKWEKVIIMADADPDGAHISSLVMKLFLLYMPDLITDGRLYRAVAPLYGAKIKGKMKYFANNNEYAMYVQDVFTKNNKLETYSGHALTKIEAAQLFLTNIDYVYTIESIASTFAIDPGLLELILMNYPKDGKLDVHKFGKIIKSNYRFLEVYERNGTIIIEGLAENKFHTVFLNDKLIESCRPIMNILNTNINVIYKVNDQVVTIYELMKLFEGSVPNNITRFKGLGEQDSDELGESVLRPDSQRMLIRYTTADIKNEIENIRALDSNKNSFFKDLKITRQDIE